MSSERLGPSLLKINAGGYTYVMEFSDYASADYMADTVSDRLKHHLTLNDVDRWGDLFEYCHPKTQKQTAIKVSAITGFEVETI